MLEEEHPTSMPPAPTLHALPPPEITEHADNPPTSQPALHANSDSPNAHTPWEEKPPIPDDILTQLPHYGLSITPPAPITPHATEEYPQTITPHAIEEHIPHTEEIPNPAPAQRTLPETPFWQCLHGFSTPIRALLWVHRLSLWSLMIMPLLVNSALLMACSFLMLSLMYPVAIQAGQSLWTYIPTFVAQNHVLLHAFTVLSWLTLAPFLSFIVAVMVASLGTLLATPYLEQLSEAIECHYFQQTPQPMSWYRFFDGLFWGVGELICGLIVPILAFLPYVIASMLPGVGGMISIIYGCLWLAFVFIGFPMARHLYSFRSRLKLLEHNGYFCFGLGFAIFLLFLIPGINFIALPWAIAAGTLLYCELQEANKLPAVIPLTKP